MNEWSVECECGADERMSEWSADGMNVIVLHKLRATHGLKTELFSVAMKHIYTKIGVCERDQETRETREKRSERERQEREDRNKECPFGRLFSTSQKPTTLHEQHTGQEGRNFASCQPQQLHQGKHLQRIFADGNPHNMAHDDPWQWLKDFTEQMCLTQQHLQCIFANGNPWQSLKVLH